MNIMIQEYFLNLYEKQLTLLTEKSIVAKNFVEFSFVNYILNNEVKSELISDVFFFTINFNESISFFC